MRKIAQVIKDLRLQSKATQKTLTQKTGIDIKSVEAGKKQPTKRQIAKICKALKIPVELVEMYSLELKDIPKHKRDLFKAMFAPFKSLTRKFLKSK